MNKIVFPPMPLIPLFMDASCRAEITSIICARDIEVAKVVLKAAENALINASIEDGHAKVRAGITAAAVIVRALEFAHD